jgi:tetratricopeptide (TPR) repeat protein
LRSLLYALTLLAVIAVSVLLLRSISPPPREPSAPATVRQAPSPPEAPFARGPSATPPRFDTAHLDTLPPADLAIMADELVRLWHAPEAIPLLERAVEGDSLLVDAWVQLIACYSHELVNREDDARSAIRRAHAALPADSVYLDAARDLYVDRDYAAALGRMETVVRADSLGYRDARYYLALAAFRAGRAARALERLDVLLDEDDSQGRLLALQVKILFASGNIDGAAARARDLGRIYSGEPYPYVLLAQVEQASGRLDAAVEFCNTALTLDPGYAPAIVTRGNLYAESGSYEAARVTFEKLLLFESHILRAVGYEGISWVEFLDGDFDAGVNAMDEAIRNAMVAGAVRLGLSYASLLVDYLCELGQEQAAEGVVDRWVSGFGNIPEALGRVRIDVLRGDLDRVRAALVAMEARDEWGEWARVMSLDRVEISALTYIGAGEHRRALELLDGAEVSPVVPVGAGVAARRSFLRGYAAFESGDAESALGAFDRVRSSFFGTEFPYRGDPVLYAQSLFYAAECALAVGDTEAARQGYETFLGEWADAVWELRAVARAKQKLEGMSNMQP